MSKKVLVATEKPFAKKAIDTISSILKEAKYQLLLLESYKDKNDFLKVVADADALIIRSDIVDNEVIDKGSKLKIVVRAGAGFDNVDLKAASQKGVVVMNTPGQNANAVAELVFGLMIYLARKGYSGKSGTELLDKSIGLHAYGNVGVQVNRIAKGFGMKVFAFDPFVTAKKMIDDDVEPVKTVQDLYKKCHYVSIHLPKIEQTIGSVNYDLMSLMGKGGTLINTARKEVIDEISLLKIFTDREDFMYGADVAPDCAAELMKKNPERCFFTAKKMGAQTSEANINAGIAAARQIVNFFEKGDKTFQVNK